MEEKLKKKRRLQYIKGLFVRIILACAIFILLFLGNLFSVNLFDYNTDKVVIELQNNTLIESIENKLKSIFPQEK
jgi:hypothetical protein